MSTFRRGDIVYMDFDPQSGHEQRGRRPALVVSCDLFNRVSSLTMVCPITNTDRRSPFHVPLEGLPGVTGFVMCDQVRMLDLTARNASLHSRAPSPVTAEAVDIIRGILD